MSNQEQAKFSLINTGPIEGAGGDHKNQSNTSKICQQKSSMKHGKRYKNKKARDHSYELKKLITIVNQVKEILPPYPCADMFHSYPSYTEILEYLNYLQFRYNYFIKVETIGFSFENRAIKVVKIEPKFTSNDNQKVEYEYRKIICIEGGTHAREWITVCVTLYFIHQLTEKYIYNYELLRKVQFHIIPLVNPDGYEYSQRINPRWRRNRRPHTKDNYVGTDCNRNFNYHWKKHKINPRSCTYQGETPFSEPECRALGRYLHEYAPRILLYLSMHSFAQSIMYPWAHKRTFPKDVSLLKNLAFIGRKSIKAYSGRHYRVGSIAQINKRRVGGSISDYVYGVLKIPLVLAIELPSKEWGFHPPTDCIKPVCRETWIGVKEMCIHSLKLMVQHSNVWTTTCRPSKGIGFQNWPTDVDFLTMVNDVNNNYFNN